jgi:hypothetical protein
MKRKAKVQTTPNKKRTKTKSQDRGNEEYIDENHDEIFFNTSDLFTAVYLGSFQGIQALFDRGVNIDVSFWTRASALHHLNSNQRDCVELILSKIPTKLDIALPLLVALSHSWSKRLSISKHPQFTKDAFRATLLLATQPIPCYYYKTRK